MAVQYDPKNQGVSYGLAGIWADADSVRYLSKGGMVLQMVGETLRGLSAAPVTAILSMVSISASLFVLGIFLLLFHNVDRALVASSSQLSVSIYVEDSISAGLRDELFDYVSALKEVESLELWEKDKALEEFKNSFSEFSDFTSGLEKDNPLPVSLEVHFKPDVHVSRFETLISKFKERPGVQHVAYPAQLYAQLRSVISFFKNVGAAGIIIILIVTGFVIASTIRLALFYRQEELAIMRLVGATAWAIRIPCLLEGLLFGLIGGCTAIGAIALFYWALCASLARVSLLETMAQRVEFLSFWHVLFIVAVGMAVGVFSGYLAVKRVARD